MVRIAFLCALAIAVSAGGVGAQELAPNPPPPVVDIDEDLFVDDEIDEAAPVVPIAPRAGKFEGGGTDVRSGETFAVKNGEPTPSDGGPSSEASPRYVLEAIVIAGNRHTRDPVIRRELGLVPGDVVAASDRRVQIARLRLLALGFFLDVHMSLKKGKQRGGAILAIEVRERGTFVIKGLFLGASRATALWGGLDVAESNFLGRGITVGGGFVQSTAPVVPGARAGLALRGLAALPPLGSSGLSPSASVLYSSGSEFFRASGAADASEPVGFVALGMRRIGGTLGLSSDLSRITRLSLVGRVEQLDADYPDRRVRDVGDGRIRPIDFGVVEDGSRLSTLSLQLDIDTRSDALLPQSGRRVLFTIETGLPTIGSRYSFSKGVLQIAQYVRVVGNHTISFHGLAGAIFGAAPTFDRFFIADLNPLLPQRALGLNFATTASRNLLGTRIAEQRFGSFAGRLLLEYSVPLWRRHGFLYRGDAFAAVGILGLASEDDLAFRDGSAYRALPIDLTADLGVRLDTVIGVFNLTVANGLGRVPL